MKKKLILKKIYTISVLIKNVLFKKKKYKLHFIAEVDEPIKRWYYDFKHWGFAHGNLEMVSGADDICELYANGKNEVTVNIICSKHPLLDIENKYDEYIGNNLISTNNSFIDKYLWGRTYECHNFNGKDEKKKMWICPVTLFVLGRYPNYIYIKR